MGSHIAVIAPPTAGHVNPLLALGAALKAHGHRVTVVHIAEAGRLVTGDAVGFAPLDGSADRPGTLDGYLQVLAGATGLSGTRRMIAATAEMSAALLGALPATLRGIGAEAVISDSAEPAGALVARHLGLPFVTSITGLPLLREAGVPPPFVGWRYLDGAVGGFRNWGGYLVADALLAPITRVVAARAAEWGLDADAEAAALLQVAQCPPSLDFPRTALPTGFHYGGPWRAPTPPVALSGDARPLIYCSLGSLQGGRRDLFAAMTRACADVGARALVGHGGGLSEDEAAALPGDPLVRAFWPQPAILPACAAAVLHGGFNTVLDALAAGVPIVAAPIAFEQPATAARIARAGAGRVVSYKRLSAASLARELATLLGDPRYRSAAAAIGREIGSLGGAERAAALIDAAFSAAPGSTA